MMYNTKIRKEIKNEPNSFTTSFTMTVPVMFFFVQVKLVSKRCIINQWDIICPLDILANGLYIILPWTRDLQTFDPNRIRDIVPSGHFILQYSVSWTS